MTTQITLCLTDTKAAPWIEGLRAALPDADVTEWQPGAPQADFAIVWAPPQSFIDAQAAGLKAMFNIGAGVDAILARQLPPGLKVVRLDDAGMSVQMAEYVCHALIRHFREFDVYEAEAREGRWVYRKPLERADFPVGILGLGVLGQRVAKAVQQFEFPVLGWSRTPKAIEGVRTFAGEARLGDFLVGTRVLVNLLPLTDATRGILNRQTLSALRPGGYLIHIARGGHLVEEDLIPLIESGQLAGATLDVFQQEPLPAEHPFWRHPKIAVTPHASARTLRRETIAQIAGKIGALSRGERIAGVVNLERGY
ncbi:glyoxylate/hydroxypyruvate reductase A [Xenophilus aerolatus]|nr:glyoxylate/hydroxypyruvate reductase A [Xenophilus aerolatus]